MKTRELVKLGIAVGANHETAARSHIRRATAAGAGRDELKQVVLLAATMCGLPRTVAGWQWLDEDSETSRTEPQEVRSCCVAGAGKSIAASYGRRP